MKTLNIQLITQQDQAKAEIITKYWDSLFPDQMEEVFNRMAEDNEFNLDYYYESTAIDDIENLEEEVQGLEKEIADLEDKISELEHELDEKDDEIKRLEK